MNTNNEDRTPISLLHITAYRTTKFQNATTYLAKSISGQDFPDELTAEDREEIANGAESMCNFQDVATGTYWAIPWEFIIDISPVIKWEDAR